MRDRSAVKPDPSLPMKPGGRLPIPTLLDTYGHVSDDISPHKQHLYDTIPEHGHKSLDPSIPLYAEVEDHPIVVMAPANTSKNPEK